MTIKLLIIITLAVVFLLLLLYFYTYIKNKYQSVQIITLESFMNADFVKEKAEMTPKGIIDAMNDFFSDHNEGGGHINDSDDGGDGGDDGGE